MNKTVDERVVSLQFDNAQFEKNVATSMSTIDKLKQKLKFEDPAKGFNNISKAAKNVDFKSLTTSVETVSSKFSALEVVGVTALANITNSAVNASKKLAKSLTIDQITSGWNKYDEKTQSVQTLVNATGKSVDEIEDYLEKLMWFSDETSYSFTEMASSLSQMVTAGGDIDKLIPTITGIANATAFAGKGAKEFTSTIRNIGQSYQAGYLQNIDWKSLNIMGTSSIKLKETLISVGESLGKIKKGSVTLQNFDSSLADKWADTEVMEKAFGKFSEFSEAVREAVDSGKYSTASKAIYEMADSYDDLSVRAFTAAQEAKTFQEAIDATKDAVSTGWMETFSIIFGNYEQAKETWTDLANDLWEIFASPGESRNSLLETVFGGGDSKWKSILNEVKKAGVSVEDFEKKFKKIAKENGNDIDGMVEKYGSLGKAISSGEFKKLPETIKATFKTFLEGGLKVSSVSKEITADFEHMQEVVNKVIRGDFGNGADRINAMAAAGENWAQAQSLVDYIWERNGHTWEDCTLTAEEMTKVIGNLSEEELKTVGYTEEQIAAFKELAKQAEETGTPINELIETIGKPSGRELLIDSFRNAIKGLITVLDSIKGAWTEIFPPEKLSEALYKLLEIIHNFSKRLNITEEKAEKLTRIFKGLFAILDMLRMVVGGGVNIVFKVLKAVLGAFNVDVLEAAANVGDAVVAARNWIKENDLLGRAIKFVVPYITKAVTAVRDWVKNNKTLQKSLANVKKFVKDSGSAIKDWFEALKDVENIPKYIISGLTNGLKTSGKTLSNIFINLGKTILDAIKGVLGIHSPSTKFFEIGKNIILGLVNGIKSGISIVVESLRTIGSEIIKVFKQIDYGKVFAATLGVGLYVLSNKILDTINNVVSVFENVTAITKGIGKMFSGVGSMLTGLGKSLKSNKWKNIGKMVLDMAIAIGILAASLYLISKIDPDRLWESVIVLAVLAGIMAGVSIALSLLAKAESSVNIGKLAVSILSIGAVLLIMSKVMKTLSGIENPDAAMDMLISISSLLLIIVIVLAAVSESNISDNINKFGSMLIKMGIAMLLLVYVIKIISKMEPEALTKGLIVIVLLSGIIVGLIAATKLAGENIDKVGGMLIKMSIAMGLMVLVIKLISGISAEEITKGILTMAAFGLLFAELALISRLGGNNSLKSGGSILSMAASMLIMVGVIKLIALMDPNDIKKGLTVVLILGALFAGLIAVSKLAGENAIKAGAMLLMAAGALLVVTGVLFIISQMDDEKLWRSVGIIAVLEALFAGLIAVTKLAENVKKGVIISLVVGIGVLALALIALSFIDHDKLMSAASAMSMVMLAFASMLGVSKFAENTKSMRKTLLEMLGVVAVLVALIIALSLVDSANAVPNTLALSVLLIAFGAAMVLLGKTSRISKTVSKNLPIMLLMVLGLAAILSTMSALNVEASIPSAIALGILLNSMASALLILGKAGKISKTVSDVLYKMLVLVAGLAVILSIMSAFNVEASITSAIALGVLLNAMASAMLILGQAGKVSKDTAGTMALLGLVVAELAVILGVMSAFNVEASIPSAIALGVLLNAMAASLLILNNVNSVSFAAIGAMALLGLIVAELAVVLGLMDHFNVSPSIETASALSTLLIAMSASLILLGAVGTLGPAAFIGIGALATLIAAMGVLVGTIGYLVEQFPVLETFIDKGIVIFGKIGEAIGSFFGGILSGFATELLSVLPAIGDAIADFADSIGSVPASALESAKSFAEMLIILTAAELINGIASFIGLGSGANSFANLADQLVPFGEAMVSFSNIVSGNINEEAVTAAANAGKTIAELYSALPKEGGWIGKIFGESMSLETFGTQLAAFGDAIVGFSDKVAGNIDEEAVTAAANAGKAMAELYSALPKEGGWWQKIFGESTSLDEFGTQLVAFGDAINGFSAKVSGNVNENAITAAANAGKTMAELYTVLPKEDGWWQKIFGGSTDLKEFGEQLESFGEAIVKFSNKISEGNGLNASAISVASVNGIRLATMMATISEKGVSDVDDFNTRLVEFGAAMNDFQSKISDVNAKDINSKLTEFKTSIESISEIANSFSDVKVNITSSLDDIIKAIDANQGTFKSSGEQLIEKLAEGIKKTKKSKLKSDICSSKLDDVVSAIKKKKSDFETAGKDLGQGLVNGINAKKKDVYDTAFALGQKAVQGEKDGQKSNSPSKLTYKSGIWFGEGLVNGINHMGKEVYNEAGNLGRTATGGLSKAIAKISNVITDDIDTQPTIRPVLDLSNITAGAGTINGMFDMNPSVGVMANVRSISSSMNSRQNGGEEVISAIENLGRQLGNNSGNTYQINGITYDDGSNVSDAVQKLIRAARIERRV